MTGAQGERDGQVTLEKSLGSVYVRLSYTGKPVNATPYRKLRLHSSSKYDKLLTLTDEKIEEMASEADEKKKHTDLEFTKVSIDQVYSLEVLPDPGQAAGASSGQNQRNYHVFEKQTHQDLPTMADLRTEKAKRRKSFHKETGSPLIPLELLPYVDKSLDERAKFTVAHLVPCFKGRWSSSGRDPGAGEETWTPDIEDNGPGREFIEWIKTNRSAFGVPDHRVF